jgi:hypothetical protein
VPPFVAAVVLREFGPAMALTEAARAATPTARPASHHLLIVSSGVG